MAFLFAFVFSFVFEVNGLPQQAPGWENAGKIPATEEESGISNFKGSREKAIMLSIGNVFAFDYKYDDALLKIDVSEPILVGILMVAETNQWFDNLRKYCGASRPNISRLREVFHLNLKNTSDLNHLKDKLQAQ